VVTRTVTIDRVPCDELSQFYFTSKKLHEIVQEFLEEPLPLETIYKEECARESMLLLGEKCVDDRKEQEVEHNTAAIPQINPVYPTLARLNDNLVNNRPQAA